MTPNRNSLVRLGTLLLACMLPAQGHALDLSDEPLFLTSSVKPLVMLDISKDHLLWKKAYNDYSDLDGIGGLETTYKHAINYYGYFDPAKCYTYSSGNSRFEPTANADADKYCSGTWSGNFLNWASMSRIDAVRKLLYGGMRSTDSATDTVLERALIPPDSHAWTKYYDGADLAKLTPYNPSGTGTESSTSLSITNTGANTVTYTLTLASATEYAKDDYVSVTDKTNSGNFLKGQITDTPVGNTIKISVANANYGGSGTISGWYVDNLSKRGMTICNVTPSSNTSWSHTNTNSPIIRAAKGNFSLWNANEGWQCLWSGEGAASNANNFAYSGIPAGSSNPTLTTHGTGTGLGDFVARVQVCVSSLLGTEKCKLYPDGNHKPIGLLQVYGDVDQIHFGLITGSYTKNISGGVLRKNVGSFTDEVNVNSNGTFTNTVGIARTLDRLKIYGYYYNTNNGKIGYSNSGSWNANGDNCSYRVTKLTENTCTASWGNPMAEIYYESLRYFANDGSLTPLYNYTDTGSKDAAMGLPQPSWTQPITQTNYCTPLNALVFNTSVSTDDRDLKDTTLSNIKSASTAGGLTHTVGTGEGTSGDYFIGANGSTDTGRCDAKAISNLGDIYGICPEGPTLDGSYLIAGLAHHARTNRIRSDLDSYLPADDTKSLKVATYGVQLATNVPRVALTLSGETTPRVIIQPAYWMYYGTSPVISGGGTLVDMKIVSQTVTSTTASGQLYVNYETSEAGADNDQDAWGIIKYCMTTVAGGCGAGSSANTISVTTDIISESAGSLQGFGYTISGTTKDGAHFHSGTDEFDYTDPTNITVTGGSGHINASGGCNNCVVGDAASTATYTLGATTAGVLKDPLYYAAKWGGFNDSDGDNKPNLVSEWDSLTTSGVAGTDGMPDNYFLVSNPLGLETALNSAFLKILKDSSASAVATNSTTLNTGTRVYQGRFSSSLWTGQLLSYRLSDETGAIINATTTPSYWDSSVEPIPEWDAGQVLKTQDNATRVILTRDSTGAGADFQYSNLSTTQQAALDRNRLAQQDNCGPERVAYLRGSTTNEGIGSLDCVADPEVTTPPIVPQKFRDRNDFVLGDVINSNPAYVGPPAAGYSDVDHPGYSAFRNTFKDRLPVTYVGANDGMLHGFNSSVNSDNSPGADAGKEVLAYVPSPVVERMNLLTDSAYTHKYYVDSSPMVADACFSKDPEEDSGCSDFWKTVLISGLGGGGKGYFALNVTNPNDTELDDDATPVFSSDNAENILLWEFTNSNDVDLGYTFNLAPNNVETGQSKQIAKFENGRWGVVIGNGYNSASGKAVLYVLFLSGPTGEDGAWTGGGEDFMKIEAETAGNNGLSTPTLFDSDANGLMDTAYAGDLKGNVWKFDLTNADPASWGKALSGLPLYTATDGTNAQPITTPVVVSLHPSGGKMVLFGTGKYLESTDNTSDSQQTLYGIRDQDATVSGRSVLTPQIISSTSTSLNGTNYRTSSQGCDADDATVLPDCPIASKGWYADLPIEGERATGSPQLIASTAWFNSFIPSNSPCDFGGSGWLIPIDYLTGGMLSYAAFDTDGDGDIDGEDEIVAGAEIGASLGGTTFIKGLIIDVAVVSTSKGEVDSNIIDLTGGTEGRITWREIVE